ncbi:PaaX family transcriptional regulator [Kocuria sp. cx-455]|uniref:PaaX family transcriptional regulator n=1 Tax=Kocuria sp. cx-455 TaxID=2771377 RepID=UPI00168665E9|nr:PaaX family transcriptional regulator C-terminal domain-containing protein [Kocuria sp. cx-455]MBD2765766.1 PaaX family transcriptional regulator [Kocuria sp. cx-455]
MSTHTIPPDLPEYEGPTAQTAIMALFGIYIEVEELRLSTKGIIGALEPLGVSEDATRITLARMSKKGFLAKQRRGRETFYTIGPGGMPVLREGYSRVHGPDVLMKDWDGQWTHVFYSIPEKARNLRRQLQSALEWGGFGRLQSGVWVAPGVQDVAGLVGRIEGSEHVRAFVGVPAGSTTQNQILQEAFDLAEISRGYEEFIGRWGPFAAEREASLHRRLLLNTEWLEIIRRTPMLPAALVPGDWPARTAQDVFIAVDRATAVDIKSVVS